MEASKGVIFSRMDASNFESRVLGLLARVLLTLSFVVAFLATVFSSLLIEFLTRFSSIVIP